MEWLVREGDEEPLAKEPPKAQPLANKGKGSILESPSRRVRREVVGTIYMARKARVEFAGRFTMCSTVGTGGSRFSRTIRTGVAFWRPLQRLVSVRVDGCMFMC
jgi:hypothetical protein